jgi:hypothetical protein
MISDLDQAEHLNRPRRGAPLFERALSSPIWGWLAAAAMVVAYLSADPEQRFGGAIVSVLAFALLQSLLPACRPIAETPLCPWNWAVFLFFLQLVILPFSLLVSGPSLGVLPQLPSDIAINAAMELNALAFLAFSATYQYLSSKRGRESKSVSPSAADKIIATHPSSRFVACYVALGLLGLLLAFGGIGSLLNYFNNPGEYVDLFVEASHTLRGVASLFLRPFLGFGLVMFWCRWIDRKSQTQSPRRVAVATLLTMLGVILAYSTFSYNRGAFVVPLVAIFAVLLMRGKRGSFVVLATAGLIVVAVLLLAPFLAIYRNADFTGNMTATELVDDPDVASLLADKIDPLDTIQMYGAGPQYIGFLLETSRWGTRPLLGATLFPSLVEPLPILGRAFRESSGPVIYNEMIYGTPEIFDQILPFSGEMFLNFHVIGVIVGFCCLGAATHWLQGSFEQASTSLEVYIWQYTAVWVLFLVIGSISVISQILFYFFWPIYIWRASKHFRYGIARA